MKITRDYVQTTIESQFRVSGSNVKCVIGRTGDDNSQAPFTLKIEPEGQIWKGCDLDMCGPIERGELVELLKTILEEIERLDNSNILE